MSVDALATLSAAVNIEDPAGLILPYDQLIVSVLFVNCCVE